MSARDRAAGGGASTRQRVARDAKTLTSDAQGLVDELRGSLQHQLEARPYLTLGAAATVGYVLAGGLASRLTALALGAGARVGAATLLGHVVQLGTRRGAAREASTAWRTGPRPAASPPAE